MMSYTSNINDIHDAFLELREQHKDRNEPRADEFRFYVEQVIKRCEESIKYKLPDDALYVDQKAFAGRKIDFELKLPQPVIALEYDAYIAGNRITIILFAYEDGDHIAIKGLMKRGDTWVIRWENTHMLNRFTQDYHMETIAQPNPNLSKAERAAEDYQNDLTTKLYCIGVVQLLTALQRPDTSISDSLLPPDAELSKLRVESGHPALFPYKVVTQMVDGVEIMMDASVPQPQKPTVYC